MSWQTILYFLVWAGIFAAMMRFGCGAHVMGHRHGAAPDDNGERMPPQPGQMTGHTETERVVDPVCGQSVEISHAKSAIYQGSGYYFCSSACRDKFEAAPEKYAASAAKEHGHGCC